jgi:hypothetical protein
VEDTKAVYLLTTAVDVVSHANENGDKVTQAPSENALENSSTRTF